MLSYNIRLTIHITFKNSGVQFIPSRTIIYLECYKTDTSCPHTALWCLIEDTGLTFTHYLGFPRFDLLRACLSVKRSQCLVFQPGINFSSIIEILIPFFDTYMILILPRSETSILIQNKGPHLDALKNESTAPHYC